MTTTQLTDDSAKIALGRSAVHEKSSDRSAPPSPVPAKRGQLVRKYFMVFGFLVAAALIASGSIEIYYRYFETHAQIAKLQSELAANAGLNITQFVLSIEDQLKAAAVSLAVAGGATSDMQFDLAKLLAVVPALSEVSATDRAGKMQAYLSRFRALPEAGMDDGSRSPAFIQAKQGVRYFGPVSFESDTDPFMIVAVPIEQFPGRVIGVLRAKVSLNQIAEVMRDFRFSMRGYGYITNRAGELIAHSDPGAMLQRANRGNLPQVRAAFHSNQVVSEARTMTARDLDGEDVLTAYIFLPNLDWTVFIEQPLVDAHRQLYNSLFRTAAILLVALVITLGASVIITRRVVRPLAILGAGVQRIGQGDLDHRLEIKTGDELEFLADEFNNMSGALKRSYSDLEARVQQRTKEITGLLEITSITTRSLDPDAVLQEVAAKIYEIFELDNVRIYSYGQNEEIMQPRAVAGRVEIDANLIAPLRGKGLVAKVAEQGEPIIFEDIDKDPTYNGLSQNSLSKRMGFRFFALLPIAFKGRVLGVVVCHGVAPRTLSEQERRLLISMADHLGPAFENFNLFEALRYQSTALEIANRDLKERSRELSAMFEVAASATQSLELEPVLQRVAEKITEILEFDAARIYSIDDSGGNLELRAIAGQHSDAYKHSFKVGVGIVGAVAKSGESMIFPDIQTDARYQAVSDERILQARGFRFLGIFPIRSKNKFLGSLSCAGMAARVLSAAEIRLTQSLIDQLGPVIDNLNLYRRLEENSARLEKANRQLKELDQLKSHFLSNVSHELRTPLTAISSLVDNMLDGFTGMLNDKQSRYITGIKESSERLTRLIHDLLDISVIESGRMEIKPSTFQLSSLITEVVENLRPVARDKAIELDGGSPNRDHLAWADRDKVTQVLTNLVTNAVKFTPNGGKVRIFLESVESGYWLQVGVSDNGPGIPPEEAGRIFDEFYQISHPGREKAKGVGLGLAICKKLIDMHGGQIRVESTTGAGSTFYFTVPAHVEQSSVQAALN